LPDLLRYFVDAIYDALTVSTTAFIKFLAAVINEVALSSYIAKKQQKNLFNQNMNKILTPLTINSPLIFCTSALTLLVISN